MRKKLSKFLKLSFKEKCATCILFIVVLFCLFTCIKIRTIYIRGNSMHPTLATGDICLLYRTQNPSRGDAVLIDFGKKNLVKRIIGMPGDYITIYPTGIVIEDREGNEFLFDNQWSLINCMKRQKHAIFNVPENHYLVLGDNRDNSLDSRVFGTVPRERVIGVFFVRLWRTM